MTGAFAAGVEVGPLDVDGLIGREVGAAGDTRERDDAVLDGTGRLGTGGTDGIGEVGLAGEAGHVDVSDRELTLDRTRAGRVAGQLVRDGDEALINRRRLLVGDDALGVVAGATFLVP